MNEQRDWLGRPYYLYIPPELSRRWQMPPRNILKKAKQTTNRKRKRK